MIEILRTILFWVVAMVAIPVTVYLVVGAAVLAYNRFRALKDGSDI